MKEPIEQDEAVMLLRTLPVYDLENRRARDIRNRACAVLSRRNRRTVRIMNVIDTLYCSVIEPVFVAGLSIAFLAWVVSRCFTVLTHFPGGLL
jgi:hypothetical protein